MRSPSSPPTRRTSGLQSGGMLGAMSHQCRWSCRYRHQESCTAVANKPFNFSATDMVLFYHVISSKDLGGSNQMAISQFIRLGFSFHYLLHLLLAISCFLSRAMGRRSSKPNNRAQWRLISPKASGTIL
ncbi:uncharacterized protein BDW70DRAFT_134472 [Aspergillus foveolatus]|uniref:uncharacterized protein n=1 Tax=Aspergillus foveolatus TaxID=210207 RepID=UPI003CCD4D77